MRHAAFSLGISMITYDMLGHGCALLAHLTGTPGAILWNTYSRYIWPSLAEGIAYQAFWTAFFATAITLLLWGRQAGPR
jgi:hypothetical protein